MNATTPTDQAAPGPVKARQIKEQVVLALQGGGALGAYQAGVYQALMEGGIEPDWVIGTSIGAINGSMIAGNAPDKRVSRLKEFWDGVAQHHSFDGFWPAALFGNAFASMSTVMSGISGFFAPNSRIALGPTWPLGIDQAAYYTTEPLRHTLGRLVDFDHLGRRHTRLSVGAVNV